MTRRTLRLVFSLACERAFPTRRVVGGNAIGNGYWYSMGADGDEGEVPWAAPCSAADAVAIQAEMQALVQQDVAIVDEQVPYAAAVDYLTSARQLVAAKLLRNRVPLAGTVGMKTCSIGGKRHMRLSLFPLLPSTAALSATFSVQAYQRGGLMLVLGAALADQPAMAEAVREMKLWALAADLASSADLCNVPQHESRQALLVHAAESRLESKLGELARAISTRHAQAPLRVVCIAGPTASGKTTFSHKLALALRAQGISASPLTVDHYYLPLDRQPKYQARQERADVDYDSIESMDVELVQEHIMALTQGLEVTTPVYNMKTGYRDEPGRPLRLSSAAGKQGVLIIEGIHALNPHYTAKIAAQDKFRIYISPLTSLQMDDANAVKSTDHRLCRRMCRDYLFRGNNASKTLSMWNNVRRGEHTWIFPHQNNADFVFNSAMETELAVLKGHLDELLRVVQPHDAHFAKAQHLLRMLDACPTWQEKDVASTSLLREFIGGSVFDVH